MESKKRIVVGDKKVIKKTFYIKLLIVTNRVIIFMDNTTVKIKKELLCRIERLIIDESMQIKYSSKKQFVNIAVLKLLKQEEEKLRKK